MSSDNSTGHPFIFGTQYYRAPTPEPECWEGDLRRMRELGFNAVKFFVQWRWSHRGENTFYFDDLDRLMDLAASNKLGVTLNTLLDMTPTWLFAKHPSAKQIDASGLVVEPYAVGHRSIGGHPGPCYNHPEALTLRKKFMEAVVEHFRNHPALSMWDVWNEPELSFQQRRPDIKNMVCYCENCRRGFVDWLREKYSNLDRLNDVWGRCYGSWDEVEMPRMTSAINDFVDWREFHLDTITSEAKWRLELVKNLDTNHTCYLHVVPVWFNSVTCADDFALAENCEVFAATMNGTPAATTQVVSAARGKVCYNVENHINHGSTALHQPIVEMNDFLRNFLPQIGLGIKGCLFWQYRPEVLGNEAPAWGLVNLDGTDRPVTRAARDFWTAVSPIADELLKANPAEPKTAIWKSRKNEIFHFAIQGKLDYLNASIEAYTQALYWRSVPFCYLQGSRLEAGDLEGISLLVMPSPYYLTTSEIAVLDSWVRNGGVLLCEAHLGGYNATTGRHSRNFPGGGLADSWGLKEIESTSSYHLHLDERQTADDVSEDVKKALSEMGTTGGLYFPIETEGKVVWGAYRAAKLAGNGVTDSPYIASASVGKGHVFYCGTNFGQAAEKSDSGLQMMLDKTLAKAGIAPTRGIIGGPVHIDVLSEGDRPRFAVVVNRGDETRNISINGNERWRGLFTGTSWVLSGPTSFSVPAKFAELFVIE